MQECRHCGGEYAACGLSQHETACGVLTPGTRKRRREEKEASKQEAEQQRLLEDAAKKIAEEKSREAAQAAYNAASQGTAELERKAAAASASQAEQIQLLFQQMKVQQELQQQQGQQMQKMMELLLERPQQPAPSSSSEPERKGGGLLYPEEAGDVRDWAIVMTRDPEGLVRDLHGKFVAGFQAGSGGEALIEAHNRMRGWILGIGACAAGWVENPELIRLGNDLLKDLRIQSAWCQKRLPRSAIEGALRQASDDPLTRAMAKVEAATKKKWDATPRYGKGKNRGNGRPGGQ